MTNFAELIRKEVAQSAQDRGTWTGELGGTTVTIYAKPLCPADHEYARKKGYPDFMSNMPMGAMVHLLARKAESEAGSPIFRPNADVPILNKMGQDKIAEIFGELFAGQMEGEDDAAHEERLGN